MLGLPGAGANLGLQNHLGHLRVLIVANSFGEPPMSRVTVGVIVINLLIMFRRLGASNTAGHAARP